MNVAKGNVTPFKSRVPASAPAPQGGNGGGDNFGERLATLEERVGHLATSKEVEQVRTEIAKAGAEIAKVDTGVRDVKEQAKGHMKWILLIMSTLITLLAASLFFLARMIFSM